MFTTAIKYMARKQKPEMRPIELKTPPEQTQTITRVIFNILKEHGPLTIAETWERVQGVGVRGPTSRKHMKTVLRWMRERQKLRQICYHEGPNKQYLYTTWFTKNDINQTTRPGIHSAIPKEVARKSGPVSQIPFQPDGTGERPSSEKLGCSGQISLYHTSVKDSEDDIIGVLGQDPMDAAE